MSTTVVFNGITETIPAIADSSWGAAVTKYLTDIAAGCLQKTGGTFTLTTDANFGNSFGLLSAYFTSRVALPATAGLVRLAKTDTIGWRNNANGANLALGINGSDLVTFNSIALVDLSTAQTLTNKTLTSPIITGPTFSGGTISTTTTFVDSVDATKVLAFSLSGATTGKTLTLSSSHTNNRTISFPDITDTVVTLTASQTMTNKTFTAPVLGAATATSINKVAITAPATSATIAIADGKTFTLSNSLTFTGTDTNSFAFPSGSDTVVVLAATQTLTNKTLTSPVINSGTLATCVFKTGCTWGDATDTTKAVAWGLSGATTAKTLTLSSSHTNNRTITIPDITDTLVTLTATQTMTNKTLTTPVISGVTNASDAASGIIGEQLIQTRLLSAATALTTTNVEYNVLGTPLTLTAGDWEISGTVGWASSAATITVLRGGVSLTSATLPANDTIGVPTGGEYRVHSPSYSVTGSITQTSVIAPFKVSISGSTTYYLVASAAFSTGTMTTWGTLRARRLR